VLGNNLVVFVNNSSLFNFTDAVHKLSMHLGAQRGKALIHA
jgi:hypothetical protein